MALLLGLPFNQILKKVGWVKASTFVNHYLKPILTNKQEKVKHLNCHHLMEYWANQEDRVKDKDCHTFAKVEDFHVSQGAMSNSLTLHGCSQETPPTDGSKSTTSSPYAMSQAPRHSPPPLLKPKQMP